MMRELTTFARMWRHLRASRDEVVAYRDRQIRRVVAHAYERVPYYRALFDRHGVRPRDVRAAEDLARLPLTSSADVQLNPDGFLARGVDPARLIVRMSGGSTGRPKPVRRTWAEERLQNAFRLRARRHLGLRPADLTVRVGPGTPRAQAADRQAVTQFRRLARFYRQVEVGYEVMGEALVERLEQLRPDVISGYPGSLSLAAQVMLEGGRRTVRPRFVTTGAEVLTRLMRRQISDAFAAPVYDLYGAHEFNLLAWECPRSGELHTCDDHVIVELLRDGRPAAPGERGEVVVTNLDAYAQPFIRYRLGDVATRGAPGRCACGVPFDAIRRVEGRMVDVFPLPGGRMLHPYDVFDKLMPGRERWARRYQVLQHRTDLIVLKLVLAAPSETWRAAQLQRDARALLGPGVDLRVDLVDAIPPEPNGKFRLVRSLVRSAYDEVDWDHAVDEPAPEGAYSPPPSAAAPV